MYIYSNERETAGNVMQGSRTEKVRQQSRRVRVQYVCVAKRKTAQVNAKMRRWQCVQRNSACAWCGERARRCGRRACSVAVRSVATRKMHAQQNAQVAGAQ